jgi:hypothetical protein
VRQGITPFVVRPGRDHFESVAALCCTSPHDAASVRTARTDRAHDLKFRVVEPLVLEQRRTSRTGSVLSWRAIGQKLDIPAMMAVDDYRTFACTETVPLEVVTKRSNGRREAVAV